MKVSGQLHAPAALPVGKEHPLPPTTYALDMRLGRPQSRYGRVGEEEKIPAGNQLPVYKP